MCKYANSKRQKGGKVVFSFLHIYNVHSTEYVLYLKEICPFKFKTGCDGFIDYLGIFGRCLKIIFSIKKKYHKNCCTQNRQIKINKQTSLFRLNNPFFYCWQEVKMNRGKRNK